MKKAARVGILLAVTALLGWIVYLSIQIGRQSTRDEAQPADLILVLGAAEYRGRPSPVLRARLDHAWELYNRHLAPLILTTGGAGGDPVFTEGGVGRAYLMTRGVPSESIIVEDEGESTLESTAMAGEIMRRMGLHSAIVVSDGYHIYRVKKMLQFRGLNVYGSPRKELGNDSFKERLRERWNYVKQAIGYLLWSAGVGM
ncbi:MAG TPA: YdcF family protein [Bryobacteraceae bacterium]|nr:YdcF family protein [Bryobacteraceae bacterium]